MELAECINSMGQTQESLPTAPSASYYDAMIRLTALLGNTGLLYATTRHNAAWMFGTAWQSHWDATPSWQHKFHGEWSRIGWRGCSMAVLKPMTLMNLSGQSVAEALHFFNIEPEELLVVHDDVELDFATVRLQAGGGLAGHNGLRSIKNSIGSDGFLRLRIGVGRPRHGDVASHVLGRFNNEEMIAWPLVASSAIDVLGQFIDLGCRTQSLPIEHSLP